VKRISFFFFINYCEYCSKFKEFRNYIKKKDLQFQIIHQFWTATLQPFGRSFVEVKIDNKLIGTTFLQSNKWSIPTKTELSNGKHIINAAQKILNTILNKATSNFTVNANNLITVPKNNSVFYFPLYTTGIATPGSRLLIRIKNIESGKIWVIESLVVSQLGKWFLKPENQILGKNILTVTQFDPSGATTTQTVAFTLVFAGGGSSGSGCGCN